MKHKYIFLFFILFATNVYSQTNSETIKLRAFKSTIFSKSLQENTGWVDANILIVFDFTDNNLNKVRIYAEKNIKYDIVNYIKDFKDKNNISWFVYKGINDSGEEYTIEWGMFSDFSQKQVGTLRLYNQKGLGFIYHLKLNE